jgi:E3 ubiquitin-protein ligase TRIP12
MNVLQSLQDLSKELLISNDQIAEDVGCQYIIKSLIDLLDKFQHIPEIAINSIVCLNAFLDLNPLFTTTIVKNGGIPKIVMMTQNIEYIDIAENAIKAIEKISTENTLVLLENEALINILNLIDFFELSSRVY